MKPFSIFDVVYSAQLACILEVSCPKPGNVNRYHDFKDTRYEHFLASGIAIGGAVKDAVEFGIKFKKAHGIGRIIKKAVKDAKDRHQGRNANLGIAMLIVPLVASCGIAIQRERFSIMQLRNGVDYLIRNSAPEDAVEFYGAIRISGARVGKAKRLDVNDPSSIEIIMEERLNLYDIFKLSELDSIAKELTTKMKTVFEIGYPSIVNRYSEDGNINSAILQCFFEILSRIPDTLIARKNGFKTAREISKEAKMILENGLKPSSVDAFDKRLRAEGNMLNPGTTADITAAAIMVALLNGVKP